LTTAVTEDTSTVPSTFNVGAVLNPEHAHNYDVLYERYLTPLGMIQAGFFYKSLTQPIVTNTVLATSGPYAGRGGIFNQGKLTISNSTLAQNRAVPFLFHLGGVGGGIDNEAGTVTISSSTLSGNSA
jgi:hypothetical protein